MSDQPTKVVIDCATGTSEHIPMTAEEIAQLEADNQAWLEREQIRLAEEATKTETKTNALSKLLALGLTEAEAKAIIGG